MWVKLSNLNDPTSSYHLPCSRSWPDKSMILRTVLRLTRSCLTGTLTSTTMRICPITSIFCCLDRQVPASLVSSELSTVLYMVIRLCQKASLKSSLLKRKTKMKVQLCSLEFNWTRHQMKWKMKMMAKHKKRKKLMPIRMQAFNQQRKKMVVKFTSMILVVRFGWMSVSKDS